MGATGAVVLGVCAAADVLVGEGATVVDEICVAEVVLDEVADDVDDETLVVVVFALSELLDPHAVIDMALIAMTAEMTLLRIFGSFVVLDTAMTQVARCQFPTFRMSLSYFQCTNSGSSETCSVVVSETSKLADKLRAQGNVEGSAIRERQSATVLLGEPEC